MTREEFTAAVRSVFKPGTSEKAIARILTAADQYAAHLVEQHAHNGTGPCQASVSAVHAERVRTRQAVLPLLAGEPDGDVCFVQGVRWVRAGGIRAALGLVRSK